MAVASLSAPVAQEEEVEEEVEEDEEVALADNSANKIQQRNGSDVVSEDREVCVFITLNSRFFPPFFSFTKPNIKKKFFFKKILIIL